MPFQRRRKKETPKTIKSACWYWKGEDLFGEGRGAPGWEKFEKKKK